MNKLIKGKDAERFYDSINKGEVSDKQKVFLKECKVFSEKHIQE
jgi:hypothetical protein